jgi:hypothetical protein
MQSVMNQVERATLHTILAGTAVHLESLLVREDVELDTRPRTRESCDRSSLAPVERTVLCAVDNVAVIVTSAVETTVAKEFRRGVVSTNLLGRGPEVVHGVLLVG